MSAAVMMRNVLPTAQEPGATMWKRLNPEHLILLDTMMRCEPMVMPIVNALYELAAPAETDSTKTFKVSAMRGKYVLTDAARDEVTRVWMPRVRHVLVYLKVFGFAIVIFEGRSMSVVSPTRYEVWVQSRGPTFAYAVFPPTDELSPEQPNGARGPGAKPLANAFVIESAMNRPDAQGGVHSALMSVAVALMEFALARVARQVAEASRAAPLVLLQTDSLTNNAGAAMSAAGVGVGSQLASGIVAQNNQNAASQVSANINGRLGNMTEFMSMRTSQLAHDEDSVVRVAPLGLNPAIPMASQARLMALPPTLRVGQVVMPEEPAGSLAEHAEHVYSVVSTACGIPYSSSNDTSLRTGAAFYAVQQRGAVAAARITTARVLEIMMNVGFADMLSTVPVEGRGPEEVDEFEALEARRIRVVATAVTLDDVGLILPKEEGKFGGGSSSSKPKKPKK
jgi:hypothetical protein